jgi:ABC-type branched-subunit amino acid transport system substrate-binding protein
MNHRNRFPARRRFLKQSAALSAGASLAAPAAVLAQVHQPALKLGLLHAVSGPDAALGRACREAALLALREANDRRNLRGLPPLLSVCADAALHAQPLAAVAAMQAQGVDVTVALLPALNALVPTPVPVSASASGKQASVSGKQASVESIAVLRLAPAALAHEASGACVALLRALPAAEQWAVASSYAAVLALDTVLGRGPAADLGVAMREAGLVVPVVAASSTSTAPRSVSDAKCGDAEYSGAKWGGEQCVLLVPAPAAAPSRSLRA